MNDTKQRRSMTIRTAATVLLCGVASAAMAQHEGDMFKMMDSNNDGKISAQEHAAAVTRMFGEMDANGDGNVTAQEMDARHMKATAKTKEVKTMNDAAMDAPRHGGMSSAEKIAKMDTNGDGMLSASEHDAGAKTMFSDMDTNGDGSLSHEEMASGHATKMKSDKAP